MSMTNILFVVGLLLVTLSSVDAHAWLSNPKPRGQYASPIKAAWEEYKPASTDPNDIMTVCRNDPVMPKADWLSLEAGVNQSVSISFNALHVGDCFFYLTYDGDKPISEMKWFKIWEQHACKDASNYNIPIPSYLPSGGHVIFRWEWYALHIFPRVEYYAQCVDATIKGSASGVLPYPQVTMPGHLPESSGTFADKTNNYWFPWGEQPMFFTGPALATIQGTAPTYTPTSRPTAAPTASPTVAPTTVPPTPAPTAAPATQQPTTPKPTSTPVDPTTRPTPPVAATTRPVNPTAAPANKAVKLNVLEASSAWWFAAEIAGNRANEITSVRLTDSGVYSGGVTMTNGWAAVWTFAPGHQGALTFPVTIKASLTSGSSVVFTVNRLPVTSVDGIFTA